MVTRNNLAGVGQIRLPGSF